MKTKERSITIPMLTRVEGEGALDLAIADGRIKQVQLRIFEPPRYFEKFLEGRSWREAPDMVARICGICPVAYQMSATHALEMAFDIDPGPWVRQMRRLFYTGEWIQSHALHIHLLAAPDYLGFENALDTAREHPEVVRRGMRLQALGNDIIKLLGGRSVHPIGARVGGFHRAPDLAEVEQLLVKLQAAQADAEALIGWCAKLPLPVDEQAFVSVALSHDGEYGLNEGRLHSSAGLDIDIANFDDYFSEFHRPHTTALHSHLNGKPYLVGPLARLNLNHEKLSSRARALLAETGIEFPSRNMFHSIVARAVELFWAIEEAISILGDYQQPLSPHIEVAPQAGVGYGCTEAPRGILWHRYEMDQRGEVVSARIIPPTSQNQPRMEEDLHHSLTAFGLDRDDDALRKQSEMVIRNYDPCISCATHFLRLNVARDK